MDIPLKKLASEMVQHIQGFRLSPRGKLQAMQAFQWLILGIGQELDRSQRQGDGGLEAVERTALADQAARHIVEFRGPLRGCGPPAMVTVEEIRSVTDILEKAEEKKDYDRMAGVFFVQRVQCPEEDLKGLLVALLLAGSGKDEFPDHSSSVIEPYMLAQVEKTALKLGCGDKGQVAVAGKGIGKVEQGEEFQLVDKTLLASFCPLGDAGETACLRA